MGIPPLDSEAFLEYPALAPPPGVTPQFVNPPSLRAPGLAVLQLTVATLFVGMRFYTKQSIVKKILPEDWWLLASWIAFACFHVLVFMMENLPLGVHQYDVVMRDAIRQGKLFQIATASYCFVALPLKVAITLQIRRIVLPCQRSHSKARYIYRWTIDFFMALNVIFYLTLFIYQFAACQPLQKSWDFRIVTGYCVPHRLYIHVASASINTASDCMTVLLPQPVIWKLKMGRRTKIGLSAVFGVGGLACVASAIRLFYATRLVRSADVTYAAGIMGKWIEPELTLGFMAACLPVLPAFLKALSRAPLGQKVRCWTASDRSFAEGVTYKGKNASSNDTVGSKDIRKKVEMDVEFEELTRGSEEEIGRFKYEEWHGDGEVKSPLPAHLGRWV